MARFRKRPVEVEAAEWTGDNLVDEIVGFIGNSDRWKLDAVDQLWIYNVLEECWVHAPVGHWIIRGVKGELYPCDPEVLEATYEYLGD